MVLPFVIRFTLTDVTIGFAMDGYNVSESNSSVTVTAEVLEGQLGRDISLLLSTSDGSGVNAAIGGCRVITPCTNYCSIILLQMEQTILEILSYWFSAKQLCQSIFLYNW